jgi:hypothetical protein
MKAQHTPRGEEEDAVRNPMTRRKKNFIHRMMNDTEAPRLLAQA